ncbi:MAG TPA: hypothetical protein DCO75_12835 [Fibrobacteres bacterium]|nr:hypothetical protein [Fibrobacterota bacterium]
MDAKFEILYTILKDLQDAGVLKHVVLVGSWCQEFYRHHFENSFEIPATRTMDADILVPRRLKLAHPVDMHEIFRKRGFVTQMHYDSGFAKFIHRELTFEFLTDAGAKADEKQHTITTPLMRNSLFATTTLSKLWTTKLHSELILSTFNILEAFFCLKASLHFSIFEVICCGSFNRESI